MTIRKEMQPWDLLDLECSEIYNVEQPLFSFTHSYKGRPAENIGVSKLLLCRYPTADSVGFIARDASGYPIGSIEGYMYIQNGLTFFESEVATNLQRDNQESKIYEVQQVRIPRVVGATIAEIIKRNIVDGWISSYALEPFGRDMYEKFLSKDPELLVEPYNFLGQADFSGYIVTKRPWFYKATN